MVAFKSAYPLFFFFFWFSLQMAMKIFKEMDDESRHWAFANEVETMIKIKGERNENTCLCGRLGFFGSLPTCSCDPRITSHLHEGADAQTAPHAHSPLHTDHDNKSNLFFAEKGLKDMAILHGWFNRYAMAGKRSKDQEFKRLYTILMPFYADGAVDYASYNWIYEFASFDDLAPSLRRLFLRVFRAVQSLHQLDILHMDIKAANIFMDQGQPFLGDFGLARNDLLKNKNKTKMMPVENADLDKTWYFPPEIHLQFSFEDFDTYQLGAFVASLAHRLASRMCGKPYRSLPLFSELAKGMLGDVVRLGRDCARVDDVRWNTGNPMVSDPRRRQRCPSFPLLEPLHRWPLDKAIQFLESDTFEKYLSRKPRHTVADSTTACPLVRRTRTKRACPHSHFRRQ